MDDYTTHSIRFPSKLRKLLKVRAVMHRRSFNAEVVSLLENSLMETERRDAEVARILNERAIRSGN